MTRALMSGVHNRSRNYLLKLKIGRESSFMTLGASRIPPREYAVSPIVIRKSVRESTITRNYSIIVNTFYTLTHRSGQSFRSGNITLKRTLRAWFEEASHRFVDLPILHISIGEVAATPQTMPLIPRGEIPAQEYLPPFFAFRA